ncbi:MAG: divalent-cation tolerance protein CutA [Steroidobacteraceae bacterium]
MTEGLVVLCTCPDDPVAERIARNLASEGLAACVNRGPFRSTYRWKGALHDEPEVLLIIKTSRARYAELEVRLKSLHPYEVPEIIALPIVAGSSDYLAWMAEQTGAAAMAGPASPGGSASAVGSASPAPVGSALPVSAGKSP